MSMKACFWDELVPQLDRIEAKLDQLLAKKRPAKPRSSKKHEYSYGFEWCWDNYPKVSGANKQKADAQFSQRIKEGVIVMDMLEGTVAYKELCRATDRRVMLPSTFYGRDKHFNCDWSIPKKKPSEDPDKQHHANFDPDAEIVIPEGINPYEGM